MALAWTLTNGRRPRSMRCRHWMRGKCLTIAAARSLGHGRIGLVARMAGVIRKTVSAGVAEPQSHEIRSRGCDQLPAHPALFRQRKRFASRCVWLKARACIRRSPAERAGAWGGIFREAESRMQPAEQAAEGQGAADAEGRKI